MLLSAFATACASLLPEWAAVFGIGSLAAGICLGTTGIGLVGFSVCFWNSKWKSGTAAGCAAVFAFLIFSRSGLGRLLGITEAAWMAVTTHFQGVGWGGWAWHQAEAQRAVLKLFPFESWKEIAPYFGVAPSLPAHLLAETGGAGLAGWLLLLAALLFGMKRARAVGMKAACAAGLTFLLCSAGTTPVQYFISVDRKTVEACDRAIAGRQSGPINEVCPEIRALEWQSPATAETYLRWHETFPRDVMPAFALGRIAAQEGNEAAALRWMKEAARGNPKQDEEAKFLKERARKIDGGDRRELKLWAAYGRRERLQPIEGP